MFGETWLFWDVAQRPWYLFTVVSEQPIGHILKEASSTPLKGNRRVVPKRRYTTTNIITNPLQPKPQPSSGGNPKSRGDVSCFDELLAHHHDWPAIQPPYKPNWIKLAENTVSPSIWAKSQDETSFELPGRQADCSNTHEIETAPPEPNGAVSFSYGLLKDAHYTAPTPDSSVCRNTTPHTGDALSVRFS